MLGLLSNDEEIALNFKKQLHSVKHVQAITAADETGGLFMDRLEPQLDPHRLDPVQPSEKLQDVTAQAVRTGGDGKRLLSVGACFVRRNWWPGYVKGHDNTKAIYEEENSDGTSFYVEILISDFRTGTARKGAGGVLLQRARDYSSSQGAKALYLDCWAGNGESLVK